VQNRISLHFPLTLLLVCPDISRLFPLSPYPHVPLVLLPHHPQPSLFLLTICGGHAHTSCSWYVGNRILQVIYTTQAQDSEEAITANDLISQAVAKLQTKDYPGALADLNHADNVRPGDYATLQLRGMLKMDIGDAEGALADLNGNADTPDASYRRGVAQFVHGHMRDAFADIASANSLAPGSTSKFCQAVEEGSLQYNGVIEDWMETADLVAMLRDDDDENSKVCRATFHVLGSDDMSTQSACFW